MTSEQRAQVASSFTIIKGAMIEETYAVFAAWDFGLTKRQNLDRLRAKNYIGASSATWLRDVAKVMNRRFQPEGRDRPLVMLAKRGLDIEEWKPLLLWHITRDEFLVRDFVETWLFKAYEDGVYRINSQDAEHYLAGIRTRGAVTEHAWSDQTTKRVAAGLLKICTDFGLLRGSTGREFASYHLPDQSFLYVLHAIRDKAGSPSKAIASRDWRLFLMRRSDVEREVLRLHQFRKLHYEVAGSLIELLLPSNSAAEYAEAIVA